MIIDSRLELASATSVALTAGASWQNFGSQIDIAATSGLTANTANSPNATIDLGQGEPLYLVIYVTTSIVCQTDNTGTIAFRLCSDDTATVHASTSTVHWTSSTIALNTTAVAAATAGVRIACIALPSGSYERYLGMQALVSTRNTTAGAVDCFLTRDPSKWTVYAALPSDGLEFT